MYPLDNSVIAKGLSVALAILALDSVVAKAAPKASARGFIDDF
jgi:hypothetical protein